MKKIKPFLILILKVIFWIILFGLILLLTNYSDEKLHFGIVLGGYIFILFGYYSVKENYKNWLSRAEDDEFYRRFCEKWHPHIFGYLCIYTIGIIFLSNFDFILLLFFCYCMELWDRRFITNDIKQDLILEKLNNKTESF